jgi:hypothetical protein
MDLDTFMTTLYVIVDDWFREKAIDKVLRRPGPVPSMSDAEVVSVALAGQWRKGVPWDSERSLVRYMQAHGKKWFPTMLERSAFNQRVRNLWGVLLELQQDLAQSLADTSQAYEIVDTVPVPAASLSQSRAKRGHWLQTADYGYGGNQGGMYWGHQVLLSIQANGMVSGWLLASASSDDRWLLQGFLSQRAGNAELISPSAWRPHRRLTAPAFMGGFQACGQSQVDFYLADRGFNGFRWHNHWRNRYQKQVLSAPSKHYPSLWPRPWGRWFSKLRQAVETSFALMSEVFGLKRLQAHSLWGLYTRLALVTTAHNLGILLNRRLGRALLSHASLIC